jgi:hypothetical protein
MEKIAALKKFEDSAALALAKATSPKTEGKAHENLEKALTFIFQVIMARMVD